MSPLSLSLRCRSYRVSERRNDGLSSGKQDVADGSNSVADSTYRRGGLVDVKGHGAGGWLLVSAGRQHWIGAAY